MSNQRFRGSRTLMLGSLVLTAFLCGCFKPLDPVVANSPDYHAGYADGCSTAQDRQNGFGSKITRVEALFETNDSYNLGWRNGFGACGGQSVDPNRYNEDQWYHD